MHVHRRWLPGGIGEMPNLSARRMSTSEGKRERKIRQLNKAVLRTGEGNRDGMRGGKKW